MSIILNVFCCKKYPRGEINKIKAMELFHTKNTGVILTWPWYNFYSVVRLTLKNTGAAEESPFFPEPGPPTVLPRFLAESWFEYAVVIDAIVDLYKMKTYQFCSRGCFGVATEVRPERCENCLSTTYLSRKAGSDTTR